MNTISYLHKQNPFSAWIHKDPPEFYAEHEGRHRLLRAYEFTIGHRHYRVSMHLDPRRGGYEARFFAEDDLITMPNGSNPRDAQMRLARELRATDPEVARYVEHQASCEAEVES